jgi:DNA-binding transcriptional LysR family regulator
LQLHQLHAFLAVAHDLSFRRAAERLCVSQPALSAQIAELERHLGVQLFKRDRAGTQITDDGRALVPVARSAVAAMAEVELAARRSPGYRRRFTAGVMYGAGDLTWPLLRTFHEARPDLELNVVHVGFYDALPWLGAGTIDALLAIGPFGEEDGSVTTVGSMPMSAILPSHHPRVDAAAVDSDWLAERVTIMPPPGMGRSFATFWAMRDLGGTPSDRLEVPRLGTSPDKVLEAISRGMMVAPWPSDVPGMPGTVIRPLDVERMAPVQIVAAHHSHPDVRQFCEIASMLALAEHADADHEP